jgi:hypothetical protein
LNEEANAVGAIETIMSAVARVGCSYEILGFDDGSQDNTLGVVAGFQAANPHAPSGCSAIRSMAASPTISLRGVSRMGTLLPQFPETISSLQKQSSNLNENEKGATFEFERSNGRWRDSGRV